MLSCARDPGVIRGEPALAPVQGSRTLCIVKNIERTSTIDVPASVAFAYVDDASKVPDWMFGITRFEPMTDQTHGVGATFASAMAVGPKTFESTMKCTSWEQDRSIVMESIAGTVCSTSWQFTALSDTTTRVDITFGYDLGGGLAGRALTKLVEPAVAVAVSSTENDLRGQVMAHHAAQG